MEKVYFLFCLHNHQPVGNFLYVKEEAYKKAYLPFLEILKDYPFMKFTLHYSGILWDFFKENHPEFLKILKELIKKGQIEIMSGGYYEPILSVIPDEDKFGQIQLMNKTIQSFTGFKPQGLWLAERVWEPHLPKFINKAGIEYIVIDDYHFIKAGLSEDKLNGYYLTEEEGYIIKVFPGSEKLRYIIPFHPPEETIEYLSKLKGKGDQSAGIFADDGEKFGIWPHTYHSVYEEGWLIRFLNLIKENLSWIEPMTIGTYASKFKPFGRVYLPCSSYMEMDEWSLPTDAMMEYREIIEKLKESPNENLIKRFIKGGFWRNFFAKYPESNDLHKRVLYLSQMINTKIKNKSSSRGKKVIISLYKAQCNDGYWHGVFGGLYHPHLRHALYKNMILAEVQYDQLDYKKGDRVEIETFDLNKDGEKEILIKNPKIVLLFKVKGGCLIEMDYRPKAFNILNTLTRREEGYHRKIIKPEKEFQEGKLRTIHEIFDLKERNLDRYLIFDRYRRASFIDHFFGNETDIESFRKQFYQEIGNFIEKDYEFKISRIKNGRRLSFSSKGNLSLEGYDVPIYLTKKFTLFKDESSTKVSYKIFNKSNKKGIRCFWGIEFNINLLAGNSDDRYYEMEGISQEDRRLNSIGESRSIKKVSLIDEYNGIMVVINSDKNFNLWRFPVETVSLSESGFERIFQGSCLLLFWSLELIPEGTFNVNIELGIKNIESGGDRYGEERKALRKDDC